ncbi:PhnA domain-containing protein [Streptomyces sp. NPDC054840]
MPRTNDVTVKDSNGTPPADGDSVTLIKDLKVKVKDTSRLSSAAPW